MKKLIVKLGSFVALTTLTFIALFVLIVLVMPPQFAESYQAVITKKYDVLMNMPSPKVILCAGSSGAYGFDRKLFKEKTGLNTVNLALHAGFGNKFNTELAKGNIQEGDIVVLAYEHSTWSMAPIFGAELVVTGIGNNIKLYKFIPREFYKDTFLYLPTYLFKSMDSLLLSSPKLKNGKSFNENGDIVSNRLNCILPFPVSKDTYGSISLKRETVEQEWIDYVNNFCDYVKSKGAVCVISFAPILDEVVVSNYDERQRFQKHLETELGAPVISNIEDYIFARDEMYDTIYHCNNEGERKRTLLLSRDVIKFLQMQEKTGII